MTKITVYFADEGDAAYFATWDECKAEIAARNAIGCACNGYSMDIDMEGGETTKFDKYGYPITDKLSRWGV
jgi:hypothetical protein